LSFLHQELGQWLDPIPSYYGMHVAATSRTALDLERVAEGLVADGVKIHTLNRYYLGPATQAGLIFGYGAPDVAQMNRGLRALRRALQQ
jgi:GntR family transcriptional regulator/MocR family aminotransferase